MSWRSLIFLIFVATQAVNALTTKEILELTRMASEVDLDSVKDLLNDAVAEDIKSEILGPTSNQKVTGSDSKMESSESGESLLNLAMEASSLFEDHEENDALHSRYSTNSRKRDDYYESQEMKSQRPPFDSPPRKTFYSSPDDSSASTSEEHFHEGRPSYPMSPRMEDHHPERDYIADVIHSESHPLLDSLHLLPPHMYGQPAMPVPPWRYTPGKSYPKKPSPPVAPPVVKEVPRSPRLSNSGPPSSPDPLISKAAVHKPKKSSIAPRMPVPMPIYPKKTYISHVEPKFKTSPKSKPWVAKYKKETITPKFAAHHQDDDFMSRSAFGKPIRQQFHEQGTRGPHSYKFGYSTGDKENPMARYEERDADGIVRGSYSYIDPRGHKQVVHYESHPKFGFKTKTSPNF